MPETPDVLTDLTVEAGTLDDLLAGLSPTQWSLPTPAPGWTIAHQVAHLIADFRMAMLAAEDPDTAARLIASSDGDFDDKVRVAMADLVSQPPEVLLARWRDIREPAVRALAEAPAAELLPWLARPLPARALAAAGIMEIFAHGQDILDTVGESRPYTDRIRHAVDFAIGNWDFGYQARDREPPERIFAWDLIAPSGAAWTLGDPQAAQRISGSAVDLLLLATRRRHRADVDLRATGPDADMWLDVAQSYRGAPGPGRQPGQFR